MRQTISQKILAEHCNRKTVEPGEYIMANVDGVMTSDSSSAMVIEDFKKLDIGRVFDPGKIYIIFDHNVPSKDIASANNAAAIRKFVKEAGIANFLDVGRGGIQHLVAAEQGFVLPGDLFVAADSHTCTLGALGAFATGLGRSNIVSLWALGEVWLRVPESMRVMLTGKKQEWVVGKDVALEILRLIGTEGARYCSVEFCGEGVSNLRMSDRFSVCNMMAEAGAKNAIFAYDEITENYLSKIDLKRQYKKKESDSDAEYAKEIEIDLSNLSPLVAKPHLPSNVVRVEELGNTFIDQAFIGSCANGTIHDLRMGARILNGRRVHRDVRLIVSPGTQRIYREAIEEGIIKTMLESGAIIGPPTCGPCAGIHMGVIGKFERAISSSNRNFVGRMGDPESEVYISNPSVVAASAVAGRIIHPKEIL